MKAHHLFLAALAMVALCSSAWAQDEAAKPKKKKKPAPFSWVFPNPEARLKSMPEGLQHARFKSPSMGIDVGYFIYLPPGYEESEERYPVVYHLHGGRPGSEAKSVSLSKFVDAAIQAGELKPTIYVFPNGGPMSWYNYPSEENGLGEDVFVKELLPHIDETYRTIGGSEGRALEGFSQGGRGTTRIMFKYPELWSSVAPGGSGYEPEKRIQENEGWESENVRFLPVGYNTWDLAKVYAEREDRPPLNIMFWVGTKGFNYEYNLKFMEYMDELGVPYEKLIVPDVAHSGSGIYEKQGDVLMQFHAKHFEAARKAAE